MEVNVNYQKGDQAWIEVIDNDHRGKEWTWMKEKNDQNGEDSERGWGLSRITRRDSRLSSCRE